MASIRHSVRRQVGPRDMPGKRSTRANNRSGEPAAASIVCREAGISECLNAAINKERGILLKADALLGCLAIALEYGQDSQEQIHYPDVAQVARDLLNHAIEALDPVQLQQLTPDDEVSEEFIHPDGHQIPAVLEYRLSAWRRTRAFLDRALKPRATIDRSFAYA